MKENIEWALAIIPALYRSCSFDSFESKNIEMIKGVCNHFIDNFSAVSKQNLVFVGNTGVGKTHLAVAIYRELIEQSRVKCDDVKFVIAPELLLEIRKSFGGAAMTTESDVIDKYSNAALLILDDLGSEKTTEFAIQSLYLVIDRRIRNMRPTIITTNLSLEEIEGKLDARIASRLSSMEIVRIDMPDYRKRR